MLRYSVDIRKTSSLSLSLLPSPWTFSWIDRDNQTRQSYTTRDNFTSIKESGREGGGQEPGGRTCGRTRGERTRRRRACLELLFPCVFTDERKRLNGQVGRRENDDTTSSLPASLLPFCRSTRLSRTLRFATRSTGCPKKAPTYRVEFEFLISLFPTKIRTRRVNHPRETVNAKLLDNCVRDEKLRDCARKDESRAKDFAL